MKLFAFAKQNYICTSILECFDTSCIDQMCKYLYKKIVFKIGMCTTLKFT